MQIKSIEHLEELGFAPATKEDKKFIISLISNGFIIHLDKSEKYIVTQSRRVRLANIIPVVEDSSI